MRCFVHGNVEAVGTCRACNKGICHDCVTDLGHSISCKGSCENKANLLHSQVMQSSVVLKTHRRNRFFVPAYLIAMGIVFMLFASDGRFGMNLGTVMGSGFIAFGIILVVLGQRYAKELNQKA